MSAPRLNFFSWGRLQDENDEEVAPKRISTPAGLRLSSIINTEPSKHQSEYPSFSSRFSSPTFAPRLSLNTKRWSGIRVVEPDPVGTPVEEQKSKFKEELNSVNGFSVPASIASPGYAGSVRSEKSVRLLSGQQGANQERSKSRNSRRRIIVGLILLFLILLAVVIGLAVGLTTKKHKSSNSTPTTASQDGPTSSSPQSTTSSAATSTSKPTGAIPSSFPAGAYSFQTFLDIPITDCVTTTTAWTCPPNTSGPENSRSLATFPFTITGSSGSYKLQSTANSNAFGNITTGSIPLTLLDGDKDSENYRFRMFLDKKVTTTINGVSATCTYPGTTIQGNLYTKMASSYPLTGQQVSNSAGPQWPFAFKLEQTASSADSAPQCVNSATGAVIAPGIASSSAESLCSCIYRNFKT